MIVQEQIPLVLHPGIADFGDPKLLFSYFSEYFLNNSGTDFKSKPRQQISLDENLGIVIGAGCTTDLFGLRYYPVMPDDSGATQLTVLCNRSDGSIRNIILGEAVGAWRTGLTGAMAVKKHAHANAVTLGVIGTGIQALTHVLAACAAHPFSNVLIYSRNAANRENFLAELNRFTISNAGICTSAEELVAQSDVLIAATSSCEPVLQTSWLKENALVLHIGSKRNGCSQMPSDLFSRASLIVTDSAEQLNQNSSYFLPGLQKSEVQDLQNSIPVRSGLTVFFSVGIAGAEILVADYYLRNYERKKS